MGNELVKDKYTFDDLKAIMAYLRSDNGCPWDKEQTHESIKMNTLEEAYEIIEAINNGDMDNLKEELGDVLLHVVFHADLAQEEGHFELADVIQTLCEKLVRRHPHVFGDITITNSEGVMVKWEEIKTIEKGNIAIVSEMDTIPKSLPALIRAEKVQKKAKKVGFDFENKSQVIAKLKEELSELEEAIQSENESHIEEEFGDLLFSMVNFSRFFDINAENSLTNATIKFINRFREINGLANNSGKSLNDLTLVEMNSLWDRSKEVNR